ncbi:MAG: B12-binding domain-containing radical SAM protein [Elusimicrobiota bacterium]
MPPILEACLLRLPAFVMTRPDGYEGPPPLGLAYVAAGLRAAGHRVSAVDCVGDGLDEYRLVAGRSRVLSHGLDLERALERVPKDAALIGFSTMFSMEWPFVKPMIKSVRRRFPRAFLVIGGEHPSAIPEFVLDDCPELDAVAIGEGDETAVELAAALAAGAPLDRVAGLAVRAGGKAIRMPRRARVRDVDAIPEPAWDLFPIEKYIEAGVIQGINFGRKMPMLASRGCPYECTFCSSPEMWSPRWTPRKPELVVAEMKRYIRAYGADNFIFYDLTAIVSRPWAVEFCERLLDEKLGITWQLPDGTRSEAIDAELAGLLHASGCRLLEYAPESGSQDELDRIKKRANVDKIARSMRDSHRAGISVTANLIFGLPGTTLADLWRTIRFVARLACYGIDDVSPSLFVPYPGSESFARLLAEGRVILGDAYFEELMANRVFFGGSGTSFCDFSPRALAWSLRFCVFLFYGVGFLVRPWRLLDFLFAGLRREYRCRAAGVSVYLLRRRRNLPRPADPVAAAGR